MTEPLPPAESFDPSTETPWDLPRFDQFTVAQVEPDVTALLETASAGFESIEADANPTYGATVGATDRLFEPFEKVWGPVGHLMGVKNSPELREAHAAVQPAIVRFGLKTAQSRPLYDALVALRDGADWSSLTGVQQRIVSQKILSAELAGVALEGEAKERFNALSEEASKLSTEFANHVLDATKAFSLTLTDPAEVDGLPKTARRLFAAAHNEHVKAEAKDDAETNRDDQPIATPENGPWRVTLDGPALVQFLQHATRRDLRETLYRAHVTKASGAGDSPSEDNNAPLIGRILGIRQEMAELLGYPHFAAVSLAEKMAPSVEAVAKLHADLLGAAKDGAAEDMDDLKPLAERYGLDEIRHWDVGFLAERLREERFEFTDEELRPYFALPNVLDGLFELCGKLFGITVEAADGEAPVWHKDVRFFRVRNEAGEAIAGFYLDPYSRPADKRGGAWMGDCLGRRRNADGSLQLPVAYLICNGTPPTGDTPSLMSFREVETLFHEFGHGLQHMLTTVEEPGAAGISGVEWDAVELPSQFMENWCYHRPTLMGFAKHHETGEPLPEELFEKIVKARTFRAGSQMCRQIGFGSSDMTLHSTPSLAGDADAALASHRQTLIDTSVMPPLEEDRTLCSFSHIFAGGYAAGYYSYKWAEVLSADAFAAFEEAGLDDEAAVQETGRRFRDTVLSLGGGEDPMTVFERFRGRPPEPDALLRHSGLADA
ncbi:M3 family metallopeptidase [Alienimonas chondri]|uniref:oligopeptidase A n=1 Tax=Alienimonas chondri TaxID=2681879 RepID=A0ABX1VAI2_9PLAN|nr:M3 family metallopeptidase [Alienimonas chondri]NNJ25064.1 Oligopeptidase A [Alienimonas chondri]